MMYPRLFLARQLLRDDGVIFVSIDDNEVAQPAPADERGLRGGELRRVFVWKKSYGGGAKAKHAVTQHEYMLLYADEPRALGELGFHPTRKLESRYTDT